MMRTAARTEFYRAWFIAMAHPGGDRLAYIEREARSLLGEGIEFELRVVDDLPLDATGKYRSSCSLVRSEYGIT